MEFTVQIRGLRTLVENLIQYPDIAAPLLQRALDASQAVLAQNTNTSTVPFRTGFLLQSFGARALGALKIAWGPDVNYRTSYSSFVQFGTAPHVILPKEAKALYWPGAAHPVRRVNHPGTKPRKYMEKILNASESEINDVFSQALEKIVQQIAAS